MSAINRLKVLTGDAAKVSYEETWQSLQRRITILNDRAWERRLSLPKVESWLANFNGSSGVEVATERLHALYLLSQFLYFGSTEIRVLLKAMFRDLYFIPLVQEVRKTLGDTRDISLISDSIQSSISNTRFLGVGNPSESGVHLLYFFRQENGLSKDHFLDSAQIFAMGSTASASPLSLSLPDVNHYVFLDDVCGSGHTAEEYSNGVVAAMKAANNKIKVSYHALFATHEGMECLNGTAFAGSCGAVYELDKTYKCMSPDSRYLKVTPPNIEPENIRKINSYYGELLWPGYACGYDGSDLLLGFHHNTPDNTIPIIWMELAHGATTSWTPAFRRYPKFVGV